MTLKTFIASAALAALALPALAIPAAGDSTATAPAPASITKETCRAQAKEKNLKGDERKAFIKECQGPAQPSGQKTRMKSCNADAKTKNLKGDARKAFMKECLSNKPAA
ncbi:PsiF family protein [Melaminivora sp.]|uniref:PsiF family protein n=1 Tax=Melaminivora sp. TaxID=1933032 RepID=UPI0028A63C18|nr:PsiF family protein [Melaminivora sp.]